MTDLTKLAQLAEQHSSSYASPHHFVLSVAGLRSIIEALAAPTEAKPAQDAVDAELEPYDAGLLNDFGGGNVEWWQDYIRAELGRAHDFYQTQCATISAKKDQP